MKAAWGLTLAASLVTPLLVSPSLFAHAALEFEAVLEALPQEPFRDVWVWKDAASAELGMRRRLEGAGELAACVVPSGTKAMIDKDKGTWAWKVRVIEGAQQGCTGVVSPAYFKTAQQRLAAQVREQEAAARAAAPPTMPRTPLPVLAARADLSKAHSALEPLRALQTVTQVGVTYQGYLPRLADTQIALDRAVRGMSQSRIRDALLEAMRYYRLAGDAWGGKFRGSSPLNYAEGDTCPALRALASVRRDLSLDHMRAEDSVVGSIFSCASHKVDEADQMIADAERAALQPR